MSDVIEVRELRALCHLGVTEGERAVAQPVELDLDLFVDLATAGASDDLADTVDYGAVVARVAGAVEAGRVALLERVATLAADAVLAADGRVEAVTVTVRKLRPPVPHDVATTGVRIHRSR